MEMNIVDARENLAEIINRVAYAGDRVILRTGAARVWQPSFRWKTSSCFRTWRTSLT